MARVKNSSGQFTKYTPKPEDKKMVEALAAFGIPRDKIASLIGLNKTTLIKYYRDELDIGLDKANAAVAKTLFAMATSGDCPAATFFWLKTRARWKEVHTLEHTGPDGKPMQPPVFNVSFEDGGPGIG